MSKKRGPFNNGYRADFKLDDTKPLSPFTATAVSDKETQKRYEAQSGMMPTSVSLPPHLFIPETAQSVDLKRLAIVPTGTETDLIVFTAPKNVRTVILSYSVFCDALAFDLIEFIPTLNGRRVYPYHGDPQVNFKIGLGLAPDMSQATLIPGLLYMNPGEVLRWHFVNNDTVDVAAGVRVVGYVDESVQRKTGRFGG